MIEITDAMLKDRIRDSRFSIKKLSKTKYRMTFDFYSVELVAICTIQQHDIHVDFESDDVKAVGIFRHSIVASALLNCLDPTVNHRPLGRRENHS